MCEGKKMEGRIHNRLDRFGIRMRRFTGFLHKAVRENIFVCAYTWALFGGVFWTPQMVLRRPNFFDKWTFGKIPANFSWRDENIRWK